MLSNDDIIMNVSSFKILIKLEFQHISILDIVIKETNYSTARLEICGVLLQYSNYRHIYDRNV